MILITGATGKLGTTVIHTLLAKTPAANIAALVRDEAKAAGLKEAGISIRVGSYDDTASLDAAMQRVEKVLLISGGGAANGLAQHQNVVDAAKKAEVKGIAYTSRSLKDRNKLVNKLMVRHFQTEDYIRESGLDYALFRNILYMDVMPLYISKEALADGAFYLPAGDGKVSYALRSDMGEAIANVLLEEDFKARTYDFTGSELYSFNDVAAALSELSGKEVRYVPITPAEFEERMAAKGNPPFLVQMFSAFMQDIEGGQESTVSKDLENKLGRAPTSLKEGLKQLFNF